MQGLGLWVFSLQTEKLIERDVKFQKEIEMGELA